MPGSTKQELYDHEKEVVKKNIEEKHPGEGDKKQSYEDAKNNPEEYDAKGPRDGLDDWGGPEGEHFTHKYPPPKVPRNRDHSGRGIRVSTEALKTFATNVRSLIPTLKTALEQIEKVKVAPGIFYDAHQLQVKVVGGGTGGAIQPTTREFLRKAIDAITAVADELEKLAHAYDTAEELNRATGKDLNEHIAGARAEISKAITGPTPAS
ncbi:hypothetical protein [Lentzea aerocolonigenes]|nr:hypothetical protein [Lentzea aerocolonigenes]